MDYRVQMVADRLDILDQFDCSVHVIKKESLPAIIKIDGASCSECVLKLSASSHIAPQILYRIAYYIQNNFPDNKIDWFTTFYHIEKSDYLDTAYKMRSMLQGVSENLSYNEKVDAMRAFLNEEPVGDIDTDILKIVMTNLISERVIRR